MMESPNKMIPAALSIMCFSAILSAHAANPATVEYVDQQDAKLQAQIGPILPQSAVASRAPGANPASIEYVDTQDAIIQTQINDMSGGIQYTVGQPLCTSTPTASCAGAGDQWGMVIYVDPNPTASGYGGVAMAISDASNAVAWGASQAATHQVNANNYGIYGGIANAEGYTTYCSTNDCAGASAFAACDTFAAGGFNDWYPPSIGEVLMMLNVSEQFSYGAEGMANVFSTFPNVRYWSSTQNNGYGINCSVCGTGPESSALMFNITTGAQFWYDKSNTTNAVRCMRPLPA